jgi:hypothetical protein
LAVQVMMGCFVEKVDENGVTIAGKSGIILVNSRRSVSSRSRPGGDSTGPVRGGPHSIPIDGVKTACAFPLIMLAKAYAADLDQCENAWRCIGEASA